MVVAAATFSQYWGFDSTGYISTFYFLSPLLMLAVNWIGVFVGESLMITETHGVLIFHNCQYFGIIEAVSGTLKLLFVLGAAFFLVIEGALRSQFLYHRILRSRAGSLTSAHQATPKVRINLMSNEGRPANNYPDITDGFEYDERIAPNSASAFM